MQGAKPAASDRAAGLAFMEDLQCTGSLQAPGLIQCLQGSDVMAFCCQMLLVSDFLEPGTIMQHLLD